MNRVQELKDKVLQGYQVSEEDILEIAEAPLEELMHCADEIRSFFCKDAFEFCSILSAKSGKCPEDCRYCAQSGHYPTDVAVFPLVDEVIALEAAQVSEEEGVHRFSMVTSGKRLTKEEVQQIKAIYQTVHQQQNIPLCASHGLLEEEDFRQLKEAGVTRYHCNLETSKDYFHKICTTHTYEDKIKCIKAAKAAGLDVCSGGLFGLGETLEDRIKMGLAIRELGVSAIPINVLVPIKGTPLENTVSISEEEVLRAVALYRYICPDVIIKLAGGRNQLQEFGKRGFLGGANGAITGNLLTTCGNTIKEDRVLVQSCGYPISI